VPLCRSTTLVLICCEPRKTAPAQDGLCHGPLGRQRPPPAHLGRTVALTHRLALGASTSPAAPQPCGRGPPAEHPQECGLVAGNGSGKKRRQVPRSQAIVGFLPPSQGLLIGPCAPPQGHHQRAVHGHSGLIPPVASGTPDIIGAAFWRFVTQLHGSSPAKAIGRRARTC
jgi:hypothetical protein